MDKTNINETLRRNVVALSKQSEHERNMMPATVAPLPSVEQVKRIVNLVKNIVFPDYFEKRQPDEAIRKGEEQIAEGGDPQRLVEYRAVG